MGESEQKDQITYTPEELEEIDRIVDVVSNSMYSRPLGAPAAVAEPVVEEEPALAEEAVSEEELPEINIGEPEDLDLPAGDLEGIEEPGEVEEVEPIPGGMEDVAAGEELPLDDLMSAAGEVSEAPSEDDFAEIPVEDLTEVSDSEIEDISDLIEEVDGGEVEGGLETIEDISEVEEPPGEEAPGEDFGDLEDLTGDLGEVSEEVDTGLEDIDFAGDFAGEEEAGEVSTPSEEPLSALDELDALTTGEPESLDEQELADTEFVDGDFSAPVEETAALETPEEEGVPEIDLDDLAAPAETVESADEGGVSLEQGIESDIPDLSDISFEDGEDIQEATDSDIPDISLDDIGNEEGAPPEEGAAPADLSDEDIPDLGDLAGESETGSAIDEIEDIQIEPIDEIGEPVALEPEAGTDDLAIEPLEEEVAGEGASVSEPDEGLELSDRELKKLKKALILLHPNLRSAIKNIIVNDRLDAGDTRLLIDRVSSGRPEHEVAAFIEKKLGMVVDLSDEAASEGRRVLHARPEYTREGRERQKRLLKLTRIFGIAAAAACVVTLLSYQYIYKPIMAEKKIHEGVALILAPGDYIKKPKDYKKAENLADEVEENYASNYIYGFNAYGDAYFRQKEYRRSYNKYNRAYGLEPGNIETLNSLGRFYSRVPREFYRSVKQDTGKIYFKKRKGQARIKNQLDLAIEFFRRTLLRKPNNITALVGIGNAYFYQGQYLKAKKYYQDIIKVDHKSPVGWGGLLNLYIERNAYDLVASTHAEIRHRKILPDLESPLLARLANYYLEHRKSDSFNARVDHGVMSPRLADIDDNTFPAVESVLRALNERDPSYPPLHLVSAKLSRVRNNYKVMKRHLDRALKAEPDYFGALHLMGAYYYDIKQPVKAYEYLRRAIAASAHPPEFTRAEFYKETENIGETYTLTGNIFYYFFDRVKKRYGNLEDEPVDKNAEKLANLSIAREKYEAALQKGYKSSELHYNLGRIYYLNRLYRKSLDQWLNLYDDFVDSPELMFALGNAFYHLGNREAAKGEYLKLINVSEFEAEREGAVVRSSRKNVRLYRSLSSAYNNLGAVYQLQKDESRSSISYWKSIDYAKRLGYENEFARVNLARAINRKKPPEPVLDENIPYSIRYYREDMRKQP